MQLNKAITDISTRFGTVSVATRQFVNLLDDVGGFKEEPAATKKIMKGLLESGFGELLYQLSDNKKANWQNSVRKCVSDYISKSGYQDSLVNNISSQLLFGLGIIDEMPKAEEPKKTELVKPKIRIKDPKELLFALKEEYVRALSELLTITNDEFGHRFGYFTTEANTKLYVLSGKIRLVAKELGTEDQDAWLAEERKRIETNNRPTQAQITQAINERLNLLERDLDALMENGYEVQDDEFGLRTACFRKNAISDFQEIEEKIIKLGKRKNEDKTSWIEHKKLDFLASKSSSSATRRGVLDQIKNDYIARLSELDKATKSDDIDFTDESLREIRRKLVTLGSLLGCNMGEWCDVENGKITNARLVLASKRKKRNIIISAIASIVVLIGTWQGISYVSSADDRALFVQTMTVANTEYLQGNYNQALSLFQKAENDYTASFAKFMYKGKAHEKATEVSDKIIVDWIAKVQPILNEEHAAEAKLLTLSLPETLIKDGDQGDKYNNLTAQINSLLDARANKFMDIMLNDISANNGKLSPEVRTELDAMSKVVQDNYWLNLVKDKLK